MDEAPDFTVNSYEDFKKLTPDNKNEFLLNFLKHNWNTWINGPWSEIDKAVILGLHGEKELNNALQELKRSQIFKDYIASIGGGIGTINTFIDDLLSSHSATIKAMSPIMSSDGETTGGSASLTVSTASTPRFVTAQVAEASSDGEFPPGKHLIDGLPEKPPLDPDSRTYKAQQKISYVLNSSKDFLWTNRNKAQITGGGLMLGGGAVALFGIFAGKNTVISAGMAKILPALFTAWATSHAVPPAAMFFYLLGALIAAAGLVTLGVGTGYQFVKNLQMSFNFH